MANIIRIKRRSSGDAGAPASLLNAELAFNEVDNTLYYGRGDNGSGQAATIIPIGGNGYVTTLVSGVSSTLNTKIDSVSSDLSSAITALETQVNNSISS